MSTKVKECKKDFFVSQRIELNSFSLILTKIISRTLVRTKYFLLNRKEGIK